MALYNCGYPIYHTISNQSQQHQEYSVRIGLNTIYTGRIYFKSTELQSETIDLSPVFREYIDVFYERINFNVSAVYNLPEFNDIGSIRQFIVTDNVGDTTYDVIYNYNTEYIQQSTDSGDLREPVTLECDPRQIVFASGYSNSGSIVYSGTTNKGNTVGGSGNQGVISGLTYNLSNLDIEEGDTVTMTVAGNSFTYNVVAPCRNRFAVYYVNKYGGLDSLLCHGKAEEGWNRNNIDVQFYDDRLNSYDFQQRTLRADIDHTFELTTGCVPIGWERRIDNLVNCVKMWVHDLEKDLVTAAQITNVSYTADERGYNKTLRHTFNVKESQKQLRR